MSQVHSAVVFDFDGVLVDTEEAKALGWLAAVLCLQGRFDTEVYVALQHGERVPEACRLRQSHSADIRRIVAQKGLTREQTAAAVRQLFSLEVGPAELQTKRDAIREAFLESPLVCKPIPAALGLLQLLHGRGVRLGLVTQTTSRQVDRQIEAFKIPRVFSVVECAGDPFYKKFVRGLDAKAVAYALACRQLTVLPCQAVAIEDSAPGVRAAKAIAPDVDVILQKALAKT